MVLNEVREGSRRLMSRQQRHVLQKTSSTRRREWGLAVANALQCYLVIFLYRRIKEEIHLKYNYTKATSMNRTSLDALIVLVL